MPLRYIGLVNGEYQHGEGTPILVWCNVHEWVQSSNATMCPLCTALKAHAAYQYYHKLIVEDADTNAYNRA